MDVKNKIEEIIKLSPLPSEDSLKLGEYLEANEWGLALEHLSATLLDEQIRVTEFIYNQIKQLGEYMELDDSTWKSLEDLIN